MIGRLLRMYLSSAALTVLLVIASMTIVLAPPVAASTMGDALGQVCADTKAKKSAYCKDIDKGAGKNPLAGEDGVINKAAWIISVVAGAVAVIMIIIGGFMMIVSGGDSQKFASGRNAVLYALVGLVVIILARMIVLFVVSRVIK